MLTWRHAYFVFHCKDVGARGIHAWAQFLKIMWVRGGGRIRASAWHKTAVCVEKLVS